MSFAVRVNGQKQPDIVTYNCLIRGLCNSDKCAEATSLFSRMLNGGVQPDMETLSYLINALCKENKNEEAISMLELMS